jgi:AcrR family transcriptional regulator
MPRPPAAKRDKILNETRQKLLDAALREFAEHGYVGANINRISTSAGFAKGTIYNYFDSKREVVLALLAQVAEHHSQYILERINTNSKPCARVEQFFQAGYEFMQVSPEKARLAVNMIYSPDRELANYLLDNYAPLLQFVQHNILEEGVESGEFTMDDSNLMTAYFMSVYLGSLSIVDTSNIVWFNPAKVTQIMLNGLQVRNEEKNND